MALAKRNLNDDVLRKYKSNEISTASQGQLIIMLYDGAIRFIQTALDSMEPRKFDQVNNYILKAQVIVTELMLSLDMNAGGEIAGNLFSIYVYLKKRLIEANVKKSPEILVEVKKFLLDLKEGWSEAIKKSDSSVRNPASSRSEGSSFSIQG